MRSLTFPIYVWPFGPSLWIISKNDMASRSCANSLQFRVHILRHNYNRENYCASNPVIRYHRLYARAWLLSHGAVLAIIGIVACLFHLFNCPLSSLLLLYP